MKPDSQGPAVPSGLCPCPKRAGNLTDVFSEGEVDFKHCISCDILIRQPLPTQRQLDEIYAQHYDTHRISTSATDQESNPHALEGYGRLVRALISSPDARVLDFGAGTGQFVQSLRSLGFSADGFEPAAEAREYAKSQRNLTLFGRLSDIPLETYDA